MNRMIKDEALKGVVSNLPRVKKALTTYRASAQKMIRSACLEKSVKMLDKPVAKQRIMDTIPSL